MKKWLIGLFILVALLLLAAYIVIPTKLTISDNILIEVNSHSAYRCLTDDTKWEKLFGNRANQKTFRYRVNQILFEGAEVFIEDQNSSIPSIIKILSLNKDSSIISWTASIDNSTNPLKKIEQYFAARVIKNNMSNVLHNMKRLMEKEENIYGISVHQTKVKDTLLASMKNVSKNYPSVENIYSLITILKDYIKANKAKETGYPMLNITALDSTNFETKVAIPVNKPLNDSGAILQKRMVPGKILVAEVKGGPYTITKAFNSLENFLQDHQFSSPAIPFESLITNRLNEKDTTKWITKLYYPIY
jgi:hypothetical protein